MRAAGIDGAGVGEAERAITQLAGSRNRVVFVVQRNGGARSGNDVVIAV